MKDELEWVRKGAKARQSKSKARLQRFEEMQSQEFQKRSETNEIYIPAGPRLGDKVIEFKNVCKGYGDRHADRQPDVQHAQGSHRRRDRR